MQWSLGLLVLAALAMYLFVALYLYAPLKIRHQQTKELSVEFAPIELPQLPPEVISAFYDATRALASNGFFSIGHLTHYIVKTTQNSYVSIWVNQSVRDSAQIIGVRTPSPVAAIRVVTLVTFHTEFTDGTAIATSNALSRSSFPPDPCVSSIRCPGIRDVPLLYRFHRARVQRDGTGRTATLDRVKDASLRMESEHRETYERLIKAGYYALDQSAGKYVPTYKGAFLMTYRLLPPFRQILKYRRDKAADRTLRELGFGGIEQFRRSQPATQ